MLSNWKQVATRIILVLWGLQIIWLCWHFAPEAQDLARRIIQRDVGAAIRREDPLYNWARSLARVIPPDAAYVFLDDYEAGKEIEIRYFLTPRRHLLLSPATPASFLFYTLHQEEAPFLIIRGRRHPLGSGAQAAAQSPAVQVLKLPGPGQVFHVDYSELHWGFYD
jgi:hypothetical protein